MAFLEALDRAKATGCKTLALLDTWPPMRERMLCEYETANPGSELTEVNLDLAYFVFDLVADRVVLAYALSTEALSRRDSSRMRSFPNVNQTVTKLLGSNAFAADRGHFLGHASGGALDINLFPQRRPLNRGWSAEGKRYRAMERYVAQKQNEGTFFYSRPIYNDNTWIPDLIEYGVLTPERGWWTDVFKNK